jgi:hypothetical protein
MLTPKQLGLLHAAKRMLGLDDDTYRAVLRTHGGVDSAKDLTPAGFKRVADHFRAAGFAKLPAPARPAFGLRAGMASPDQVKYIQSLWRQVSEAGDRALDRWLERTCKVTALRFLTAAQAQAAITGLKAMVAHKRSKSAPPAA